MSFPSRGRGRGSIRGNRQAIPPRSAPSGPSNANGNASSGSARGGSGMSRGMNGAANRGRGAQAPRGGRGGGASRGNPFSKPPSRRAANGGAMAGGPLKDRYEQLKKIREMERKDAERQGIVSAPGQARLLSDAVTPVGTCLDMCAEWERVERAFQNNVAPEESDPDQSAYAPGTAMPVEARMVKKFKRPGAGDGDQLPSDLRPPHVLKTTCDYLFRDLLTNASSLASVHGFIWDRTRAIRNDFSIQQVSKLEDVRIAIECFERIARFHILALHQMATPESQQQARKAETTYDPQQEREQLDRTLLSLMQYYDDYRGRLELTNEAEFRSYCVIFQLDSSQTDTEDRVQTWPKALLGDRKIQAALQLFSAACTTFRRLGPFKALAAEHVVARQDWEGFWKMINSTKISYLQACVAEIYFHLMRDMVLRSIVRAMRASKAVNGKVNPNTEWSMHDLRDLFHFDDDEQLVAFCALYDLEFHEVGDEDYLDVSPVAGRNLQTPTFGKSVQESSWIVEQKRLGRSLAAVIDGLSVQQARSAGMLDEGDENEEMANVTDEHEASGSGEEDPESLFIPEDRKTKSSIVNNPGNGTATGFTLGSPFAQASGNPEPAFVQAKPSTFGQPSGGITTNKPSAFGQPTPSMPLFGQPKPAETSEKKPAFSFLGQPAPDFNAETKPAVTGNSAFPSMTAGSLFPTASTSTVPSTDTSEKPASQLFTSPFGQPASSSASSLFAPKQDNSISAGTDNPFKAAAPSNPFLAPTAAPNTAQDKQLAPAFTFSKPDQPQSATALFTNLSPPAPAASNGPAPGEPNSKSTTAQTSFTAPQQASPPSTSHGGQDANTNGSQSPPRRSSINNLPDTKPKKPSPLSHSFTASEDSSSLAGAPQIGFPPTNQAGEDLFPGRQKTSLPPSFPQTKPAAQSQNVHHQAAPSFDAVLTRISEELTIDPVSGFLKQYVDYTVKQVITKVQEDLYWERLNGEADEFRTWFLQDKFGKRWRETCRRQRLAKQGRERRKRAQKRLHESRNSDTAIHEEFRDAASSLRSSRNGSIASHQSKREMVDAMYKSTMGGSRFPVDRQAQAGSKRSVSSQGPDSTLTSAQSGHKRMKSTSHLDDHGHVVKPETSASSRSSFLNFALANNAPNRSSTTKSPYFRMKALGIKPSADIDLGFSRGIKRQRSESMDPDEHSQLNSSLLGSSPDQLREGSNGLMRPPSTRSVRSKTNDDDEALFARLKAAREGLAESGSFLRSEVEKDGELRRSASSLSDRESPSLARARADVRLQASQADSDFGASLSGREVPAYRLRQSRFVPREQYGRAIERANELLASRSEQASKSESKPNQSGPGPNAEHKSGVDFSFDAVDPSLDSQAATIDTPNGITASSGLFSKVAPAVQPPVGAHFTGFDESNFHPAGSLFSQLTAPASQMTNGAPIPFMEDSMTHEPSNPFLHVDLSNGSPISQTQGRAMPQFAAPSSQGPVFSAPAATATIDDTACHFFPPPSQNTAFGATATFGGTPSQFAPPPSQNPISGAPSATAVFDNTIQESQIDSALAQSFGQDGVDSLVAPPSQWNAPQQSNDPSTAVSLSSDGEGSEDAEDDARDLDVDMNEEAGDDDESQSDASVASVQFNPNASANRFAMLDEEGDESESQQSATGQQLRGQDDEELASDEEQTGDQPDSYQYDNGATGEYDSDNGEEFESDDGHGQGQGQANRDGAINNNEEEYYSEEQNEDAEDEMDFDSGEGSYDEDDEENEDGRVYAPQPAFGYAQPQPNEALQVVGNNVEEAIELSD